LISNHKKTESPPLFTPTRIAALRRAFFKEFSRWQRYSYSCHKIFIRRGNTMSYFFLKESDLKDFVRKLISSAPVIAPVARKNKFVFADLESPDELRLDYDITILPPKKAFFPPNQTLLSFKENKATSAIRPREQILFGVHTYDVKAIDMLDLLFAENNADNNYLANRKATTIVAMTPQAVSGRAFWESVGKTVQPNGHDALMTKIREGYVFEPRTPQGTRLTKSGIFSQASSGQLDEASKCQSEIAAKCPEKLSHSTREISDKMRASFNNEKIWHTASLDCFSCGTCNIVCPTCYCFDVQDQWNLDQVSGARYRTWDACLTEDFAKISLGPAGAENFREERAERFRHRMMRKATYLNSRLGGPACVGCGRCSEGCVPDIADPVKIINNVMES